MDIFVSIESPKICIHKKTWVMSFRDPYNFSDDVIPGHARIGTCETLSMYPGIRILLNSCLRVKPETETLIIDFSTMVVLHTTLHVMQRPIAIRAQKNNQVTCGNLSLMI